MEIIAIENAVGQEDKKSENAMVVARRILNGMSFPCPGEKCQFYTPVCAHEKVALQLLKIDFKNDHETGSGEPETKGSIKNRMWLPEILALDPNNDNEDAYRFWLDRFHIYLKECHITKTKEKYDKLLTRLAFNIYQHVVEAGNYEELIEALDRLYVKKRNIFSIRNVLVNCKQKVGENVKTYLLRLNQLAKHCKFKWADSGDMIREEWVSQTFITGL